MVRLRIKTWFAPSAEAVSSALNPVREIISLSIAAVVYFGGRVIIEGSDAEAFANADRLLDLEASLGIDTELSLQQLAADHDFIRQIGNLSYVWLHWPLLLTVLAILAIRDPALYRQLRNALFASGVVGLFFFFSFPMAPPRFIDGFVGTVSDEARRHYLPYPQSWANKYAAFPSFHVGWTLVACLALAASFRRRAASLLAIVPAILVSVSVVTTGNHYIIDSIVGGLIALSSYIWFGRSQHRSTSKEAAKTQRRLVVPPVASSHLRPPGDQPDADSDANYERASKHFGCDGGET